MLGVAMFCGQFPSFLFSIAGGVASDRYNRFNVMLTTQAASLIQAVILTILVYLGDYSVWHILTLSVVLGIINAFDVPARQALIYDMVSNKEHLSNAIALNSSMVNVTRLIGPALAGLVLTTFGASLCFLSNAISFLTVIFSLLLMKLPEYVPKERVSNALTDLREGFVYLKQSPDIGRIILMLAFTSFFSLPYVTLLPVYAKTIFSGNASTFGLLNSFVGLGALSGALFLASLKPGSDLKKILFRCTIIFGVGLTAFSYMPTLPFALVCIVCAGFGMMSQTTISNTLIQTTVAPTMRGRVISFYAMAFFGMQPFGGLLAGWMAHRFGAPLTILIQGIITLIIALSFMPFLGRGILMKKQKMKLDQLEEQAVEAT